MDFLKTNFPEHQKVVLLLIIANQGTTRLLLYRWSSWQPLATVKPSKGSGYPLPSRDAFPHLLIPSCKQMSFAIMAEQRLVFYDNITSKALKRSEFVFAVREQDKEKQWVQWAKPVRHEQHKKNKEDIFLIREDGVMRTAVVNLGPRTGLSFDPGQLDVKVDTAVCALSSPPTMGGDILIVCGDATDGGVFQLMAKEPPTRIQTIPNWSPINDMVLLDQKPSVMSREHGIALAATGLHERRAALTELRYGLEAQIGWTIKHSEATTIDRLWALERRDEGRLLFLASHHEQTSLLSYELENEELSYEDSTSYPQLCFDLPTLAAGNLDANSIIQITTKQVFVLSSRGLEARAHLEDARGIYICAAIDPFSGCFVVANRREASVELISGNSDTDPETGSQVTLLPQKYVVDFLPVAMDVSQVGSTKLCFIGSQDGKLHLFTYDSTSGLEARQQFTVSDFVPSLHETNISSLAILALDSTNHVLVICGLRTGQVLFLKFMLQSAAPARNTSLSLDRTQVLGSTAVTIKVEPPDAANAERSAFVTCGSCLRRVLLHRNKSGIDYTIESIVITNRENAGYTAPSVAAVDRIGNFSSSTDGNPSGLLACVAGDEILLLGLHQASILPRPIQLIPPTKNLVYCSNLKKCVMSAHNRTTGDTPEMTEEPLERPSLHLVQLEPLVAQESSLLKSRFFFGEKGEKTRVLLNWAPTDGKVHFDMIVIGSQLGEDGRLAYMNVTRMSQPKIGGTARLVATYPNKPVTAICPYGMSSLIVCADKELKLLHLDMATKRWQPQADFELPSRAIELRAKGSVVYVATSKHSFLLIREENQTLRLIGSDSYAGKALNVVPHGSSSTLVNLVEDQGSRLLNFAQRPTRGTTPSFEARLSQAIDKLANLKLASTSPSDNRERFLATSIDGMIYLFTTLTKNETKLLKFLEGLCQPIRTSAVKSATLLAQSITQKYAMKLESTKIVPPPGSESTHARGDLLKALLEPGPYNIQMLLRKRVKTETEMVKEEDDLDQLTEYARPVIGSAVDVVDGVVMWLRRLLNVPSF